MTLSLKPSCSPSAGPEPYLLPHFSLQAISSPGSCRAHQAAWGSWRASSPARPQHCCQVVALPCSCGPGRVTCTHIWKCTCGRLWTPCPSSGVFNSKPALCLQRALCVPGPAVKAASSSMAESQRGPTILSLVLQTNVCLVHFLKGKWNSGQN